MENQHRKISGYRELSQAEIDLMNEAKDLEAQCLKLHDKIRDHLLTQDTSKAVVLTRQLKADPYRWLLNGKDNIEFGFMALVRSIAQPQPKE